MMLLRSNKYPAGIILIVFGVVLALIYGAKLPSLLPKTEHFKGLLNIKQVNFDLIFKSLWIFVLPQIPLSVGNAIVATEDTLKTYFGGKADKVEAGRLSFGMGCFNILAGLFGGVPCCHGCAGVTAHYRFGARTGSATLFAGIFYTLIAAAVFFFGTSVFSFFPYPVLGVLLVYAGIEHGLLIGDVTAREDLAVALIIASIAFATKNMSIAFICGMIVRKIAAAQKIFA
jgi:SulP family sulfate permease